MMQRVDTFKGRKRREQTLKILSFILLLIGSAIMLIPLLWMISTALKSDVKVFEFPPKLIPSDPQWYNFVKSVNEIPFWVCTKNTVIITAVNILGTLISSSLVAFGLARIDFKGKNAIFLLIISTMMVPQQVVLIPQFILFKHLGWINTFKPLIIPEWFGASAFNIFLLRQFFMGVPKELDESAMIDGCSRFKIYYNIILPLSRPALAAIAIFAFMYNWNDFMRPLIFIDSLNKKTLALGLTLFQGYHVIKWNLTMAASTIVVIPCLIAFFLGQRYFIEGVTMTGIKG